MPRPTVYEVAKRAGVSIATVSFTYRQPERVRPATRAAVEAAAAELGYLPSVSARNLARGKSGVLGMYSFDYMLPEALDNVLPNAANTDWLDLTTPTNAYPLYVNEVQYGFEQRCQHDGVSILLGAGSGTKGSIIDIAGRVDGLAALSGSVTIEELDLISKQIPVVVLGSSKVHDRLHNVTVDNKAGIHAIVNHLVKKHKVKSFGFIGTKAPSDFLERFVAFQDAMAKHGLPVPDNPISGSNLADPYELAELPGYIENNNLPRALVCASDQHALAVLNLLAKAGLRVPKDVIVTGFDGILAGQMSHPSLTTVRQPMAAIGKLAADILLRHAGKPNAKPERQQLPVQLIVRESCGCATK